MYSASASRCSDVSASAMRSAISFWSELLILSKVSVMMSAAVSSSRYHILSFTTSALSYSPGRFLNMSTKNSSWSLSDKLLNISSRSMSML